MRLVGFCLIGLLYLQDAQVKPLGDATGHLGPVTAIRRHSGRLVTGGKDGTIKIWSPGAKKPSALLPGHDGEVHDVATNGSLVVSSGKDKTLRVWSISKKKELRRLEGHETSVRGVTFGGGRFVTAGADGRVIVWSAPDFSEVARFETESMALDVETNGSTVWVGCNDGIHVLDVASKTETAHLKTDKANVQCIAVGSDVVGGYTDGHVRVWRNGRMASEWEAHQGAVYSIDASGSTVVTGGQDYRVKVWSGQRLRSKFSDRHGVRHVGLISGVVLDGQRVISASFDGTLRVWQLSDKKPKATIEAHGGDVSAFVVTPDGRLITGGYDRSVRVWSVSGKKQTLRINAHKGRVNAVLSAGRMIVSAGDDGVIAVWDASGKRMSEFQGHRGEARALALTKSGQLVTGGYDGVLRFWRLGSEKPVSEIEGVGEVDAIGLTPDGRKLVSVGMDRAIKVWDPGRKKELGRINGVGVVYAMALTRERALTGTTIGTVTLYDLNEFKRIQVLGTHASAVNSVSLTKKGDLAVTTDGESRTVKLWDVEGRKEIPLSIPLKADHVAIHPNGKTIICADRGVIRFFSLRLP